MPDPAVITTEAVRRALGAAADPERAPGMQAYMKSAMPFHGVPMPTVRRICRAAFDAHPLPDRESWARAVRLLWDDAGFREERYAAVELTGHRAYRSFQDPRTLPLYRQLVVTGAWWDLVDGIAAARVGPVLRAHHDEVAPVLRSWARDEDLWLRRTAVLAQLGSKGDTDRELLADVLAGNLLDSRHGRDFFIRKAVGWALREHAKTDPDWVRAFLDVHAARVAPLTRREALKNIGPG